MKKIMFFILSVLLAFSLMSCHGDTPTETTDMTNTGDKESLSDASEKTPEERESERLAWVNATRSTVTFNSMDEIELFIALVRASSEEYKTFVTGDKSLSMDEAHVVVHHLTALPLPVAADNAKVQFLWANYQYWYDVDLRQRVLGIGYAVDGVEYDFQYMYYDYYEFNYPPDPSEVIKTVSVGPWSIDLRRNGVWFLGETEQDGYLFHAMVKTDDVDQVSFDAFEFKMFE